MRISDWSSDVCSSDLRAAGDALAFARAFVVIVARLGGRGAGADQLGGGGVAVGLFGGEAVELARLGRDDEARLDDVVIGHAAPQRSEEHTSDLQSLMRTSYAVFCLKKKKLHRYSPTETPQAHLAPDNNNH